MCWLFERLLNRAQRIGLFAVVVVVMRSFALRTLGCARSSVRVYCSLERAGNQTQLRLPPHKESKASVRAFSFLSDGPCPDNWVGVFGSQGCSGYGLLEGNAGCEGTQRLVSNAVLISKSLLQIQPRFDHVNRVTRFRRTVLLEYGKKTFRRLKDKVFICM